MFTLAISFFITSNLPWFVDLTSQVPMQYCSLQQSEFASITSHIYNWVLLFLWLCLFVLSGVISPLISTSMLGTHWLIFQCPIFFAFSYCSWGSQGNNAEVVCHSLSSGPCFFRTLHHDLPILRGPTQRGSVDKAVVHLTRLVSFLWLWFSFCLPSDGKG